MGGGTQQSKGWLARLRSTSRTIDAHAIGNVKADGLADQDAHFIRGYFCEIGRAHV